MSAPAVCLLSQRKPGKFYECGICDCIHPWEFSGDCREDAQRYALDELEDDDELLSWEDRLAADAG